jgi:hypothetical protein
MTSLTSPAVPPTASVESPSSPAHPVHSGPDAAISTPDKFVLWMFVLGFLLFAVILIADLVSSLFR